MKMTTKDVKEITYMPLVTFFNVLERPGKNRKGGCNNPLFRTKVKIHVGNQWLQLILSLQSYKNNDFFLLEEEQAINW